ncbi:MAG: 3-phosphoshikimate 1-carboxyvinyltransferase [Tenuifilaceae bacterium]|jgi:3-phosphoshikimate 1-carboxyvinyltransferase|nr:3-phosphoshikimate 1-carboxyvinyltransferase [Tenuifilaceae bacterium]
MRSIVKPSSVNGTVVAPASKSVAQRAIAIASVSKGKSVITNIGDCDDVLAAINVCRQLGATIHREGRTLTVEGGIRPPAEPLLCGESGLGIRMFTGIASSLKEPVVLTGSGSLTKRPMSVIEQAYTQLGVSAQTTNGLLPISVNGPIVGGEANIDGSLGSQVLSGMLIASVFAQNETTIHVDNLQSKHYIDITIDVMKQFGVDVVNHSYERFTIPNGQTYKPATVNVEGDWSGAAFMLAAGAIAGKVAVENVSPRSKQPDMAIINALMWIGANVSIRENSVEVSHNELQAFHFDATHCPDLFPPLVALAAHCEGESRILGVSRLKAKESDRAKTLQDEFAKLGIDIKIHGELMLVTGGKVKAATVNSHSDHRIAMACAIAALKAEGEVIIEGAECVAKSYPEFFANLASLSAGV